MTLEVRIPVAYMTDQMTPELLKAMVENAAGAGIEELAEHGWITDTPVHLVLMLCPNGRIA